MRKQYPSPLSRKQQGVVLLESLIAVLIFMLGLLGLVGLQASMLKNTTDERFRAIAGTVAQKRLSDIWLTDPSSRNTMQESPAVDISADSGLPSGQRTTIIGSTAANSGCDGATDCYIVTVFWTPPGGTQHQYALVAHID